MMAAEEMTQERLIGPSPDDTITIETDGRVIRPAMALPGALVNECRLHADTDGLQIRAVDPSNVCFVAMTIHEQAFDAFDAPDDLTIGLPLDTLQSQLRGARMGLSTADPVALDLDTTRTRVEIERDYDSTTLERVDGFLNFDPDSIRGEPDMPDLEMGWHAAIDPRAFTDAINHLATIGDHVRVTESDGDLELGAWAPDNDGDPNRAGRAIVPGVIETGEGDGEAGATALYSLDYVTDIAEALRSAKVDTLRLEFGDEFPMRLAFERTAEDNVLYEGEYIVAPRIRQEGTDV